MKKKRIVEAIKWAASIALVLVVLGFSAGERRSAHCRSMEVQVEQLSGVYFIDESTVIRRTFDLGDPIIGTHIDSLNLRRIRSAILDLPSVKDASVYVRVDGQLMVNVLQRRPLFRVIGTDTPGYYIDTEGKPMPLSPNYSARVPAVTGAIPTTLELDHASLIGHPRIAATLELVRFIEAHPFWSAQTEHIVVLATGEFELIPRVGAARIQLGDATDLATKFNRLQAFYQTMAHQNNLNKYKRINVKYREQVVCERYF